MRDDQARMKKQIGNLISISDDQQELIEGLNEFSLEVKQYIDQKRESGIQSNPKKPKSNLALPTTVERPQVLQKLEDHNPFINQRINELEKKMNEIKVENFNVKIVRLNAMFEERLNEMMKIIDRKVDRDELERLDEKYSGVINDIIANFERYPDREDVLKALLILEDNVYLVIFLSLQIKKASTEMLPQMMKDALEKIKP